MKEKEFIENPVEEYFKEGLNGESTFQDLFEATRENVDLRTDLLVQEIVILNKLFINHEFLKKKLDFHLLGDFIEHYLRLMISKDRKSRGEFVDINRKDRFKEHMREFADFSNILEVKK